MNMRAAEVRGEIAARRTFSIFSVTAPGAALNAALVVMGDKLGLNQAARHVHGSLKPDGTWMIVEPYAEDRVEGNLNPVGRAYYAFSTLLCTPASLSQEVGLALGAQAGEARIRDVVTAVGFTRFRRATETPFNLVYEARP
jgi:hypothetical protein